MYPIKRRASTTISISRPIAAIRPPRCGCGQCRRRYRGDSAAAPTRPGYSNVRAERPQEIKPKEPKVHDSEPAETASVESEPTEVFASASEADSTVASQAVQAPENGHKEGEGLSLTLLASIRRPLQSPPLQVSL